MDHVTTAVRALISTLRENLPARLAALDADRAAPLLQLSAAPALFLERTVLATDADVLRPIVAVDRTTTRLGTPYTTGEALVSVRLECFFPGPAGGQEETLEATRAFAGAVLDVVHAGDGRGPWTVGNDPSVTVCRPKSFQVESSTKESHTDRHLAIPVGRALPEFEIQVWI